MTPSPHTPGPWRVGRNTSEVVADVPNPGHHSGHNDHVEHYGGYLIAESILPNNVKLVAAAPDLLDALRFCRSVLVGQGLYDLSERLALERADAAIAKATG